MAYTFNLNYIVKVISEQFSMRFIKYSITTEKQTVSINQYVLNDL